MPNPLKDKLNWPAFRQDVLIPAGDRLRAGRDWVVAHDPVYTAFRRPGRVEKSALAVVLALAAALVVFLIWFDWNHLRGPIGRWASAHYDREIQLNGDLDVNLFSWTPSVVSNDLRIGGPDWAREQDTLKVGRVEASVVLRRLFVGQIEMPLLAIDDAQAVLIATEDGRQSWNLNPDRPDDDHGMKLPLIRRLLINDGVFDLTEARRGIRLRATVTAREGAGTDAGFRLQGQGSMNGTPLTLAIQGGPFINIRRNRPYAFTARLEGVDSVLTAEGAITRPFDLGHFQADLSLEGRDLADLYLITGITLPNTPQYALSGDLSRDGALFRFNDFSGRVGSSDLSGDLSVDKVGERRRVEADLTSRSLDIDDLAAVLGARPQVTAGGDTVASSGRVGRLLPDAPLNVERLRAMDGRLTYRAASVKRNDLEIRQVNLGAGLDAGILNLDPVSFAFNRGELNGRARIDANRDTPFTALDFRLSGYPLESIIPARNGAPTVTGRMLGRARLEGSGASVAAMAASSSGQISMVVPQGQMRAAFAELLGINASAGLLRLLSGDESTSTINCAVGDFNVQRGIATARTLIIDTDVVVTQGSGTINLRDETLDLKLDGESKRPRLLRVWAPILIRGPLSSPSIGVDVGAAVGQSGLAAAVGALVAPLAALIPFLSPGGAEDAPCAQLVSRAR